MSTTPTDGRSVTARAAALAARQQVQYWVVLSYQDGLAILDGRVPPALRRQVITRLKREQTESADEYAARVAEARA
jgi:hypothetical protein